MKLVYFENERGDVITLVVQQIAGIQQNRVPTDTPTTVMLTNGQSFRVRNGFDDCQKKLMATLEAAHQADALTPTGWSDGLSQDSCKELGQWLANRPGARQQLREMLLPPVDAIGAALELESQAKTVESQTTERAMLHAANCLRLLAGNTGTATKP